MGLPPIPEVKEVIGFEEANKYLRKGWVLVSTHMAGEYQPGVTHPTLIYVVGRPEDIGPRLTVQRSKPQVLAAQLFIDP